jgi:hypothetical protein
MWLDRMIQPQSNPWLLRWDLKTTDFLDRDLPPAFVYYNPFEEQKQVSIDTGGAGRVQDLTHGRPLHARNDGQHGKILLTLGAGEARVIELRP